jgi:hypothetical protein
LIELRLIVLLILLISISANHGALSHSQRISAKPSSDQKQHPRDFVASVVPQKCKPDAETVAWSNHDLLFSGALHIDNDSILNPLSLAD